MKLHQCVLFENVPKAVYSQIGERKNFEKDEILFSPELDERKIGYILIGGCVVETKNGAFMRKLEAGDLFGVANLFTETPFVSVIRAEKRTEVHFFTAEEVENLLENETFRMNYIAFLSGRIRFLNKKINYLSIPDHRERVLQYLKENETLPSMSKLSEILGISRATLYRVLKTIPNQGDIKQ